MDLLSLVENLARTSHFNKNDLNNILENFPSNLSNYLNENSNELRSKISNQKYFHDAKQVVHS